MNCAESTQPEYNSFSAFEPIACQLPRFGLLVVRCKYKYECCERWERVLDVVEDPT